jgi:hypothetical protein
MTGLEYFYSAHLGYSYLGSALFMETSWAANRPIAYRPIDLCRPRDGDNPGPTNGLTPARRDYFSGHEIALSNGMLIAGLTSGRQHRSIGPLPAARALAQRRGSSRWPDAGPAGRASWYRPDAISSGCAVGAVQAVYKKNSEETVQRSVFGSPT